MSCSVCKQSASGEDSFLRHHIIHNPEITPFNIVGYGNIELFCLVIAKFTNKELFSLKNINNQTIVEFINAECMDYTNKEVMLEILRSRYLFS